MTCIAGLASNGLVTIAGDALGSAGTSCITRKDPKVFRRDGFVMGFTSSFRMGQVLAHRRQPPRRHPDDDIYKFMVTDFIDSIRESFKQAGFSTTHNGAEAGGAFLVGITGRLFKIEEDYQVGESACGYDACGCGEQIALGALYVTGTMTGRDHAARLRLALDAASEFDTNVRGPYVFASTDAAILAPQPME